MARRKRHSERKHFHNYLKIIRTCEPASKKNKYTVCRLTKMLHNFYVMTFIRQNMFLKLYNIVNLTNLASVICFLSPVQMSSVMNFPALQLTLLKSGLQTARKYGRSRPINSLPASVKRLATIAPKPNMNMRNAILVGEK